MTPECFISVDIEASGPIPGKYSMLSLGACVVGQLERTFYIELKPISPSFEPAALSVSGLNLEELFQKGIAPTEAMASFRAWVKKCAKDSSPVFVGFNACFDWQFVNWYFVEFCGSNPFGHNAIDIKSYFMGLKGVPWAMTTSSELPAEFQPDHRQTHQALDDARAQAEIFSKLLAANSSRRLSGEQ